MTQAVAMFEPNLQRRRHWGLAFETLCVVLSVVGLLFLAVLIARVLWEGLPYLSWQFLNSYASILDPEGSGMKHAIWGSAWLIAMTALFSIPIGVAAALYLEEYAVHNRLTRIIQINIANLAGVPSIVYGILGLTVFVRWARFDRSLLSGALTLSLLIMPVIIIATREALVAVPRSIRHAAMALGATRWQMVRAHVLPAALPGIMTGVILSLSRAIGEAAPLLILGAWIRVAFTPQSPMDAYSAMPLQIYFWCEQPQEVFQQLSATGILVLLGILLPMNAIAIGIRAWHQRHKHW